MKSLQAWCEQGGRYLASSDNYQDSRLVLVGAPMDFTVSFRPGSRGGPQAIRAASPGLEEYSLAAGKDLRDASFYDAGDILLPIGNTKRSLQLIEAATAAIFAEQKFPLLMGGEHLISLGALRAAAQHHKNLVVLHLDAHADLRTDYLGEADSHAAVMYHAHQELGLELFQFGIRSATAEELAYANQHTHFYPYNVLEAVRQVLPQLTNCPVYLSLDIDVVDPAYAPGTGTPEPGGITAAELLTVVSLLSTLNVVGMDLVEVSPAYDPAGITAMLAAKVIREMILAFA
ncbi:MAG TPA: agmatinase [Oscillospiraceae bacterium]|nr:agmatinase [Oscillospiraceae bacterium]